MRSETMRAMVLSGFGSYDKLYYRPDIPVPKPADDEVLVKVAACGVNNTDIRTRAGTERFQEESPFREIGCRPLDTLFKPQLHPDAGSPTQLVKSMR